LSRPSSSIWSQSAISAPVGVYDHPASAAKLLEVWSRRISRVSAHALS